MSADGKRKAAEDSATARILVAHGGWISAPWGWPGGRFVVRAEGRFRPSRVRRARTIALWIIAGILLVHPLGDATATQGHPWIPVIRQFNASSSSAAGWKAFMRVSEYKGCSYVSLAQVAALFDGHLHWRPMAKQVDLKLRGHRIRFPYGARTAYVNGRRCSLEGPTIRNEQGFWVPASFFATPAFCRATQTKLEWPSQRPLPPGRPSEAVKKIVSSPRQVVGRGPASTENGWGPAYSLPGRRIFHTFSVAGARGEGASATASKSPPAAEPALSAKAIRRIVIDPGHGGKDPGTVSARGVEEKEINLSMAQELADVLREQGGYEVLMTRTDDTFVPLEDRAQLANRYHADLFISLHCNASLSSKLKGFEVYFLSEKASDPHADAVARFENASLALEGKTPSPRQVETVLRSLVKTAYINESSSLGSLIDREVAQRLSEPSLGVKQAAFYVLRGAEMPAVLVEAGFLSNAKEARLLQKDSFRRRLIGAVAAGIQAYDVRKRQERR